MMKHFLFLVICFNFLQSETFQERQNILLDIKNIVQYEESLSRAYEQYIIDNYRLPSSISNITTLIGGDITAFVLTIDSQVNTTVLTSGLPKINYALGSNLITDSNFTSLYESDTFRKKTYVRNNAVYFILEDSFAKHLFDLIKLNSGNEIKICVSTNTDKVCIKDSQIYINPTYTSGEVSGYIMSYRIDKFKTGPIIVTNDTSKYISEDVFSSIPRGALIYDIKGVKYVKTLISIEALK